METKNNPEKVVKTSKKTSKKIIKTLAVLLLTLILTLLVAVPWLISSQMGNGYILGKINSSIAGKTDFSNLLMSWYKGIKIT
ncbi:MAG TPA: hypothetical protein PLP05_08590, partial [Sedimentisphaerales bacterium]|nr:hypothetical protein [Sedimentisphaerales bacterium]